MKTNKTALFLILFLALAASCAKRSPVLPFIITPKATAPAATMTITPLQTAAATLQFSATATHTQQASTFTRTESRTCTLTATDTATVTDTATPSITASITSTDTETPDYSATVTGTYTNTWTFTDTATITMTLTMTMTSTITVTFTVTPSGLLIENCEDNNTKNLIPHQTGNNDWTYGWSSGIVTAPVSVTGGGGGVYGNYCVALTGTATIAASSEILLFICNTYSALNTWGYDYSAYTGLKFSMATLQTKSPQVTVTYSVRFYNMADNFIYRTIAITPGGTWQDFTFPISSFSIGPGSYTANDVMINVKRVEFFTSINSPLAGDTAVIGEFLDNISLY
jgi:hypothetical protein